MGLFSKIFSIFGGGAKSLGTGASFLGSYRVSQGKSYGGGGWGLARFNSIVAAHSSPEELVEEFSLDSEDSDYASLDGFKNCYTQAYMEALEEARAEAEALAAFGIEIDAEALIDWDAVEENAYNYSIDLVNAWLDGSQWIPENVMDYAWYELSSHNG